MQYNNWQFFLFLINRQWVFFQDLHFLQSLLKHKIQHFAWQFDISKNFFNINRSFDCLLEFVVFSLIEQNLDISYYKPYFEQHFTRWCSFIISWLMQYISNFSNLAFLFKLLISFFLLQYNLWIISSYVL